VAAHKDVEVSWIEQGRASFVVRGRKVEAGPGDVVVIPAQDEHHTGLGDGFRAGCVKLDPELVAEVAQLLPADQRGQIVPVVLADARPLVSLIRLIVDEVVHEQAGSFLTVDALAEALTVRLLRRPSDSGRPGGAGRDPRVSAAVDRILSCYAEPLSVDTLAETASMSRFHFSRLFSSQVGLSPYRYLLRTRISRAAELLGRGRHSVTEAAFTVGFSDLGRFSRAFRRQFGCSPSAYRRRPCVSVPA